MGKRSKAALLASTVYTNALANLPDPYIGGGYDYKKYSRAELTKKQKKRRAAAKRAKKARKKNR